MHPCTIRSHSVSAQGFTRRVSMRFALTNALTPTWRPRSHTTPRSLPGLHFCRALPWRNWHQEQEAVAQGGHLDARRCRRVGQGQSLRQPQEAQGRKQARMSAAQQARLPERGTEARLPERA
eukprot:357367-Chlamydomonas_euryale.AAC.6